MIKIICIGKIKENYLRDAIHEYTKRISKYTKLEIYKNYKGRQLIYSGDYTNDITKYLNEKGRYSVSIEGEYNIVDVYLYFELFIE